MTNQCPIEECVNYPVQGKVLCAEHERLYNVVIWALRNDDAVRRAVTAIASKIERSNKIESTTKIGGKTSGGKSANKSK